MFEVIKLFGGFISASSNSLISFFHYLEILEENFIMDLEQEIKELKEKIADFGRYIVPTGTVIPFAGSKAPNGWLLCDGKAINRVAYAPLFEVVGETYGSGDGSTTFNLPDLRGRTAIGYGQATGLASRDLGQTLGEENHVLTIAEMPNHAHGGTVADAGNHSHSGTTNVGGTHAHSGTTNTANPKFYRTVWESADTLSAANHQKGWKGGGYFDRTDAEFSNANHTHNFDTNVAGDHNHALAIDSSGNHQHTISSEGGSEPHNNMQPSLVLNYIIKT